ncbi:apolipoprotein A-I-like isoform X1 [Scleropages formosus]|nr:apolipoprotein A-I-like isoform X1 [Scleropages formosus]
MLNNPILSSCQSSCCSPSGGHWRRSQKYPPGPAARVKHNPRRRVSNAAMKVLVVLALAAFSCCQANVFWPDQPKPQLEQVRDAFWDYVAKATQTAEDTLQTIRQSELGQEVNAKITESADAASQYTVALRSLLAPLVHNMLSRISQESELLKERLEKDLSTVRGQLEPYTEDLKFQIQQRVEQLKQEMAPYAESLDTETLKATVLQKSEELKGSLEQSVKELQSQLGPYTEELMEKVDQRLQEFQKSVAPMAENIQNQMVQRAEMMQKSLTPYSEDLREKLDPYAQNLKAKLAALWDSFTQSS